MKFIVGYDGSNCAKEALAVAARHAQAFDARIHIIASLEGGSEMDAAPVNKAKEDISFAEAFFKEKGVEAEPHLLIRGLPPGQDIVKYAVENNADMIFIGVRRRSKVGKLIFGSNAHYIILKAPCPVVSVQ